MRITITAGANTYLIAGESHAHADGNFQGRLLNEINLSEALNTVGAMPVTLNLSIRNDDGYVLRSVDLWAATVEIEADGGQAWAGKITAYDNDSDGVLRVVATERAAPEIEIQIPDEVARLVTVDENFHTSAVNVTLPLVVGGTVAAPHLIKGILIDKTAGIYLLCVGEIHQVVKVYRGTEELSTGYDAYTGTALQASYAGIAYVQITDEDLLFNDDGSYAEISAEVVGAKLGASTIEECRNGARFLQYLLTTAATGACGWGLGIASEDLDSTSFSTAISRLDTAGLKLDGVFYFRQTAQAWIDQICQAIRGSYSIGGDGQRRIFVNASGSSVKTYTASNMRVLRDGKGAYTGRVYNKGKLDYGYNPITGQFMQSAFYEDATSIAAIGEQEFYGQSYLIKDATTAQAILEYNCKKSLIGADKVLFETDELAEGCRVGDIITVAHTGRSLTGDWQITKLDIGDYIHTIEAEKYSTDIFAVGTPGTAIDWVTDQPIIPSITPGAASGLTLSSEIRPGADGTNIVVLSGTFTQPASAYFAASIEYGEGALPILDWKSLGMVQGNSFEIVPVKPAQLYAVRIRMISSTGKSDYITATLTTQGDDVAPGQPSISATSYLKNVSAIIALGTVPSDLAGFQIFRHTANNSAAATLITSVSSKDGRAKYDEVYRGAYGDTLYYWAKAFDTWGNIGSFSTAAGPLLISAINGTDIVDAALNRSSLFQAGVVDAAAIAAAALKSAGLAAGAWSAQNCTTASIAEAGGVIDISGQGNHGQAVGGVAVVADNIGSCFSLDTTKHIVASGASLTAANRTFSIWYKKIGAGNAYAQILAQNSSSGGGSGLSINGLWLNSAGAIVGYATDGTSERPIYGLTPTTGEWYHIALVIQGSSNLLLYINGVLYSSNTLAFNPLNNGLNVYVGGYSTAVAFLAFAPRIYDRALSATEIKSLYMFPGDVAFARVTADYVAALAITAEKIAAEAVTTAKLAAGAVTTEKLLIGKAGAALNDDPNFEDSSAWNQYAGTSTYTTVSDGKAGNTVLRSPVGSYTWPFAAKSIALDPNKTYRVRVWVRKSATSNGILYVSWRTFNAAGAAIPAHYGNYIVSGSTPGTAWTEYSVLVGAGTAWAATSDARTMRIGLGLNHGATLGYMEAQDFRIEECLPATLIQDGSITTDKINVAGLNASVIKAGSLDAARIAAGSLSADKITGGAIVVGGAAGDVNSGSTTINGGKITAASITVSQINSEALRLPAGAIAAWSAKGSTSSTIILTDGVKDTSGNGKHGTASAGVAVVDSDVGKAFSFDGVSTRRILVSNVTYVNATEWSFSCWSKKAAFVQYASLYADYTSTNRNIICGYEASDGAMTFYAGSGTTAKAISTTGNTTGELIHWAFVFKGGQYMRIYRNGELAVESTSGVPASIAAVHNADRNLGRYAESYTINGLIAHPQMFARALTPAEIKASYMLGADSESGTITADRVVTGQIKSLNYSTTAGSMIDLDDGTFKFGGSSAPKLSWNGTSLTVTGTVYANAGTIGGLAIGSNFLSSTGTELISSKYSVIGVLSSAYDGAGTLLDTGSSCFMSLSYTSGPYLNSMVRIGATGYYDGSSTSKAHIKITAESAADYAIDTNGKIQGDTIDISDERLKGGIQAVSTLDKLKTLSVTEWHYDDEKIRQKIREEEIATALREGRGLKVRKVYSPDIDYKPIERHIGPMAADFNKLFGVSNGSETGINLSDGIGVALRAIQELAEIVDEQAATIAEIRAALKLPEKQKKQANAADFAAEEIERVADGYVKAAYDKIMQELKK